MNTRSVIQGSCFKDKPHIVDCIGSNWTLFLNVLTIASISEKMSNVSHEQLRAVALPERRGALTDTNNFIEGVLELVV